MRQALVDCHEQLGLRKNRQLATGVAQEIVVGLGLAGFQDLFTDRSNVTIILPC
jgi:hypothetical protein